MNICSIRFRLTAWYTGLLAALLLLFGTLVYLGLRHYLNQSLSESLSRQARQIGEGFLIDVATGGEGYVISEINEHYAPELNNRFVRITRADGSVLYVSGNPKESDFDPAAVPGLSPSIDGPLMLEVHQPKSELLIYAMPFTEPGGKRFLIEAGAPYEQIENVLHGLLLALGLGLPLTVTVAISGGYLLMRRALDPVDEITRSAEQITSHNLAQRLPIANTGDELERLSVALNRMIARLEESFQYLQRFSADASHELRTPLTVLRGELEAFANRRQLDPEGRETIGSALEETERLSRIVESLLAISRLDAGEAQIEHTRLDLAELAISTTDQMRLLAEDKKITLKSEANGQVHIEGDRARLKQVIVNLVDNAIKYTPEGGTVLVKVNAMKGEGVLVVEDNGAGIPAEALPHIFERFYRVDKVRSRQMGGTGLGLAIVKSIVTAHGGRVTVESAETGSRFRVELPIAETGR
jgi:heavy metal sensor kinase